MCGICGVFNVVNRNPVKSSLVKSMADTLIHRGPDDEGIYCSGPVGLGHRRLAIIDIEGGQQPMANKQKTVWVVFNGEIYNFHEVKSLLASKGYSFHTQSDTEVIIALYEEYGEACFQYLRGMFAIAIWDENTQQLFLARDRVGKKPLFYYYDHSKLVFASEIKAILKVPGISRDINLQALSDYFSLLYIPAPKTIYRNIYKVRPGHFLIVSEGGLREVEYWDVNFEKTSDLSVERWCEEILEKYSQAVQLRLISDVPLGAFLSGGIDSSSVVALMTKLTNKPVVTSSIGFNDKDFDESHHAREIAQYFNAEHYERIVNPDAAGIIEKLVWHYDEPFADSSAIPTYYVSQLAREHVTVALSGDGGDEIFAGYRRYLLDKREDQLRGLFPKFLRQNLFRLLAAVYPKADWAPRVLRGKATFENLACSHIEAYFRSVSAVHPELKANLFHPDVQDQLKGYDTADIFRDYYQKAGRVDPLSRIQYVDFKTYLPDDILVKVDRASMAHSLEVRAPMLDHLFVEMAATIPSAHKLRGKSGKNILKMALRGVVPQNTLERKKMGFAVPLAKWFRGEMKDLAHNLLFEQDIGTILNRGTVEKIWNQHQKGYRDRSTDLWTVFIFGLWYQQMQGNGSE